MRSFAGGDILSLKTFGRDDFFGVRRCCRSSSARAGYPAIIWFLEAGGKEALITGSESIERALAGETGTRFVP